MASKSMLLKTTLVLVAVGIAFLAVETLTPENSASQEQPTGQSVEPEQNSALVCFQNACVTAELAVTGEERSQGLMFREQLGEGEGMLFVFESEGTHSFWMKNTLIPLDIIWIDKGKRVVHIEHAVPCTTASCASYTPSAPALYVLETGAGFVEKNRVSVSDIVNIDYK